MNAILALLAGLPSLLVVRHVRSRLGTDPAARTLWATFLLGALSTFAVLALAPLLASPARPASDPYLSGLSRAILSAALPEEGVKFAVLCVALRTGRVHDRRSGLAHGLAASLGFAAVEMVLFASLMGFGTTAARTLTTLPCHAFLGCAMGSVLGGAGRSPGARRAGAALLLPVLLHGAYDFPLMVLAGEDSPARPGTWAFATLALLGSVTVVGGATAAACLYRDVFPRLPARSAPTGTTTSPRASLGARVLIPLGALLASAGCWMVVSVVFATLPAADLSPTAGRATTALWAVGAALLCFGLALGLRGLRTRGAPGAPGARAANPVATHPAAA